MSTPFNELAQTKFLTVEQILEIMREFVVTDEEFEDVPF